MKGFVSTVGVFLLSASTLGAASGGAGPVRRPLSGARYQTLCGLAAYLDRTAQGALEGAADDARHGTSRDARFLSSIRAFAQSTADFHRRIDAYPAASFDVAPVVEGLGDGARKIDGRIREVHALPSTYDEWEGVIDVLQRMRVLLDGGDVEVPAAYIVPVLSGAALEQFRRLSRDLDLSTARAHATARHDVGRYGRGQQFLGELTYFAAQSRGLHLRADTGGVDPRLMGPLVDHLLEEARLADRRMRDAQTFAGVWDDSGRTITILERMASLVRS